MEAWLRRAKATCTDESSAKLSLKQRAEAARTGGPVVAGNTFKGLSSKRVIKTSMFCFELFHSMLWRAPWLRRRLALMGLAAWDAGSVYICYNLTYLTRLGKWEGLSVGLVVVSATWLGVSYLAGRYSPTSSRAQGEMATQVAKTLIAAGSVVGVFVGHSWVYQVVDAQTRFRGFLIPLVIGTCVLSSVGMAIRERIEVRNIQWILAANEKESQTLARELGEESKDLSSMIKVIRVERVFMEIRETNTCNIGVGVGSIEGSSHETIERLLELREKGRCVIPLMSWCEQELQRIPPELVSPRWLVQAEGFGLRQGSFSWRIKRFGDIVGALSLVLATAPLVVISGIFIWIEDQGPIFYKQTRSGLYGKPIRIWKLRSMRVNAESDGAAWAAKADPRITRVGKLIRATRIDELPQLLSVLKGDLSLIGPRPERPEIEEELEKQIPNYRVRHWIRPGLSGWAQVCYPYGASVEDSRMKLSYDLYYLRNTNILLDLLIALKTFRLVALAKGARPNK